MSERFSDIRFRKLSEFRTGEQKGFFVESNIGVDELRGALEEYLGYKLTQENSSIEFSGASLSEGSYHQLKFAIVLAFLDPCFSISCT